MIIEAIKKINPNAEVCVGGTDINTCQINWLNGTAEISKADIEAKMTELQTAYDNNAYQRTRASEYPSIADLVVALYDTDDKSAIEAKRASVKAKYPKP